MSIWRSPVFYFGIGLLMVVGLLLVAPFVVDWNSYKSNLEAYGKRLTGRDVTIAGDIEVRLFPWPRLTADDISVGNPQGISGPDLIAAEQMTLSLALGALMNGTLSVESIAVSQPRITLLRSETGDVNWMVKSDEDLRSSTLLSQVRLDQIRLSGGTVRLEDRRRGLNVELLSVDSDMSAQTIEGPWKLKGSALYQNAPLAFSFTSASYDTADPFKFILRVTPGDTILPSVALDGGWDGVAFDGTMQVAPQVAEIGESQKGSIEGGLRPLTLSSDLRVTAERADFKDIRIAPADVKDSGTLIEGTATVVIGEVTDAEVKLKAPRIHLDTLVGAETLTTWRDGGALALAHTVLKLIPESMSGRLGLDVTVLTTGGASLENVEVLASLTPDGIHIERAKAGLPGRSKVLLTDAMILRKDGAAELSGPIAFESQDTRAIALWAWPQHKEAIENWWKGNRGRLKFAANTIWSASQFALVGVDYELDSQPGKADIKIRLGATNAVDVVLKTRLLDLDSYLARDVANLSKGRAFDALALLQPLLLGDDRFDTHIKLDAGVVALNSVSAQGVAFDVTSSRSGFEIKTLNIGDVGGATVKAQGLMLSKADGPSGEVTARVAADDPAGFLRLIGAVKNESVWQRSLGKTDVGFALMARPDAAGPQLDYTLQGRSGPFVLNFAGSFADLDRGADAQVSLSGDVSTDDASRLLAVVGLKPKQSAVGSGDVKLGFSGSRGLGFATSMTVKALGASFSFDGLARPAQSYGGISGQMNLQTEDVLPILRALGVPVSTEKVGPLRLAMKVSPNAQGLSFTDVVGDFASAPLSGSAELAGDSTLKADIALGHVDIASVLAVVFAPWEGGGFEAARRFGLAADLPVWGEIWLRPTTLALPFSESIGEAAIGLTLGDERSVKVLAPTSPDVEFSIGVAPVPEGFAVSAKGRLPINAGQIMRYADGTVVATGRLVFDGEVTGKGRSPGAVLAELSGKGGYAVKDFTLLKFAPDVFAKALADVKSATDLAGAFGVLEASSGVSVGESMGSFAMKDGAMIASPILVIGSDSTTSLVMSADAIGRSISLVGEVKIPTRSELPPVSITYSGEPAALTKRSSTAQLAALLGHDLLARDLEALEKLQQQQKDLLQKEEVQRRDDVAKFEAYQSQRSELRQRQRELKVYAVLRERREAAAQKFLTDFTAEGDAINKVELVRQRLALELKTKLASWALENADPVLKAKRDEAQRKRIENAAAKRIAEEAKKMDAKQRADAKRKKPIAVEEPEVIVPEVIVPEAEPLPVPDSSLY